MSTVALGVQSLTNVLSHVCFTRREALLVPSLQQGVCRQVQSQGSPTDPFGCEKIPMQELLQNLLQDVSSAQTWGIWLLCSTLNWDTFSTTTTTTNKNEKEKLSSVFFFTFPSPGELLGNHTKGGLFTNIQTSYFFSTTGRFHFKVRNSSVLASLSFQSSVSVIAISVELCQTMYSPTCAIHALSCMSRKFYMPSQCYLQCLYQYLSVAVMQFSFLFTSSTKRCILNEWQYNQRNIEAIAR